ncbi:PilZ domain-containing protein [Thiogranum longum]
MERRRYERSSVNLKVALVDDQKMPLGCRVRDVSQGGMLLQYEHYASSPTLNPGDTLKIRVSLRQGDERKVLMMPATVVRRVEDHGVGVAFGSPQEQLMELVEPYLLDKPQTLESAVIQGHRQAANAGTVSGAVSEDIAARSRRRKSAIRRARANFADETLLAREEVTDSPRAKPDQSSQPHASPGQDGRGLFYVGLLSLAVAFGVVVLDFADSAGIRTRVSALEATADQQSNALAQMRTQLSPVNSRDNELAGLNTRVDELATSLAALEMRFSEDVVQQEAAAPAATETESTATALAGDQKPVDDTALSETTVNIRTEFATADRAPKGSDDQGPWVINLVSLDNQVAAEQFANKAKSLGLEVLANRVVVKDKEVWRLQVTGFTTRDEAQVYGNTAKDKLGLKDIWIYKR